MGEATGPDLRAWVESMARDLVDHPDAVEVRRVEEAGVEIFELAVDPSEMGRVIGRQGRTAQALRSLLFAAAAKHGRDYELEILD